MYKIKVMEVKFAQNIRAYRKELGMTQVQLADKLNVAQSTIARWESGEDRPAYELLCDICKLLNTNPNELLGYEDF